MPSVEERLAYLEGRVEDHGRAQSGLDDRLDRLSDRINGLDLKIDRFREGLSTRIDALDAKIDRRYEELSRKMSSQFAWLVGIQVSVLLAVVGALVAG